MTDQPLFFKRKNIEKNDAELTFYKECPWLYNREPLPVVKYRLLGCRDIQLVEWDSMDVFNDGVLVETIENGEHFIFQTTDLGGYQVQIACAQIIREDGDYSREDLMDLIEEVLKQREADEKVTASIREKTEELRRFLVHELDIVDRKMTQAEWLSQDKKQFLYGQRDILQKVHQLLI